MRVVPSCRAAAGHRLMGSQHQSRIKHCVLARALDESSSPVLISSEGTDHRVKLLSTASRHCCLAGCFNEHGGENRLPYLRIS